MGNIVANNLQVAEDDERKTQVIAILQRLVQDIRGGPTKATLHQLQQFVPGDEVFQMAASKKNMATLLLRKIQEPNAGGAQQDQDANAGGVQQNQEAVQENAPPVGVPPAGWGDMVPPPARQQQRKIR